MIRNYITTAFRSLWRNKQFAAINMAGLALGITVFLFIVEYIAFEWSANRFNKHYNQLYRANVQYKEGNTDYYLPPGFAPLIKQQFPAIETYVRVADGIGAGVLTYEAAKGPENKVFREDNILYVDSNFLNIFSFPLVAGTPSLSEPKTLALSEDICRKLLGTTDAIGKTLTVSNQFGNTPYTVKAVYRLPQTSDIKAAVLLSFETLKNAANRDENDWADPNTTQSGFANIYLQLQNGANATSVANSITPYLRSINPDWKNDVLLLQPFRHLHLAPSFDYPFQTFGNLLMVLVFAAIAVLILLIAWINYINLSIAQSLNRAKEIGVRKVLGASRPQLVLQYLTETFVLTLTSTGIAILLVNSLQSGFNQFADKPLSLAVLNNGWFWLSGMILITLGSLLAGSYVAFALTSFKPIAAIYSKVQANIKGFSLRKALVVFQFTISVVLIIATVVIYKQLRFMKTENLGMNLNQLLVITGPTVSSEEQAEKNVAFKNSLAQLSFVKKYAASNNVPGVGYNFETNGIYKTGTPPEGYKRISYSMFICDQNFFDTYGIQFVQGHTFSQEEAERSWNNIKKVIINQKAATLLGFDANETIIGKKIVWSEPYEIIGVVKDYHHLSLREAIKPTIYLGSVSFSYFTVQTGTKNMQSKIDAIRTLYNKAFPGNPFDYFFADDKYNQQYQPERKLGSLFIAAACVALFIACMGLFGLISFSVRQRVKEIGIRKVLGAGVSDIVLLLSKDFTRLITIAIIVATPIAWWSMNKWLQNFAYRTEIAWWIFIVAAALAIGIALLTISVQAIKAATANPIKSLRTE